MKTYPFQSFRRGLAFFLVCGGIAVSNAATSVIINFGTGSNSPDYANTITASDIVNNAVSGTDLKAIAGGTTGWNFSYTTCRGLNDELPSSLWNDETAKDHLDEFAASLGLDSLPSTISKGGFGLGGSTGGGQFNFALSGLTANATYEISFGLGRNRNEAFNVSAAKGTLQGSSWFNSSGQTGSDNTQLGDGVKNQQRITTLTVVADSSGEIQLTGGSANLVYYSALQFASVKELAIPETSTASFGLLALGSLMLARRRRA